MVTNPIDQYFDAMEMMGNNRFEEALEIFLGLKTIVELAPLCYYRVAQVMNMTGDPEAAYDFYYNAFITMPNIASKIVKSDHSSFKYVFPGKKEEKTSTLCPLCRREGSALWCYPLIEANGYNEAFNPVRMWMYCDNCEHIYARDYPENVLLYNDAPRTVNPALFSPFSNILSYIVDRKFAPGLTLFDVGVGACEFMLTAREMGYETFGIDVIESHVEAAKSKFGLNVERADFNEFVPYGQWDIITMGSVLEHVKDPAQAIQKAEAMLSDEGAIWISTPNYRSAFADVAGHNDNKRREQFHLNYFSKDSLLMLLVQNGLSPVDYRVSPNRNGLMEVIAIKSARVEEI